MAKKQLSRLSDDDLRELSSGGLSSKTKKVLKWVGVGIGTTAGLALIGVGAAALVGWKKNIGPFKCLYDEFADIPYDENIEISKPFNFRHYVPSLSEQNIIIKAVRSVLNGMRSIELTADGPKLF